MSVEVLHAPAEVADESKTDFRNYNDSEFQDRVAAFYFQNRINQTVEFVKTKKAEYAKLSRPMKIWDAVELLNELVDQSDPDTDSTQIVHLLQTAEAIRKEFPGEEYDWFHLTGFIHDLGKIIAHPKFSNEPQWCTVGDTFPVGCQFAETNVFHKYFERNPDFTNEKYNTKLGMYTENCGLDNVLFSWGHDEYMYQVCKQNKCLLPQEALYIIRFHSFYPWHTYSSYDYLCNETDRAMLKWVKLFQKFDLYSKLPEKPDLQRLLPYYQGLLAKYFPQEIMYW
jgi:inositol oxygenase